MLRGGLALGPLASRSLSGFDFSIVKTMPAAALATSRDSSISQHLRAIKKILQDASCDAKYV